MELREHYVCTRCEMRRSADSRAEVSGIIEFMFVSFWDSVDALAEYTGGDPERPKYYPEDRAVLLELPEGVEHYQVVDLQARW